jgi:hypothetical protein
MENSSNIPSYILSAVFVDFPINTVPVALVGVVKESVALLVS